MHTRMGAWQHEREPSPAERIMLKKYVVSLFMLIKKASQNSCLPYIESFLLELV